MKLYDKIDALCVLNKISRKKMCEKIGLSYHTYNSMLKRESKNIALNTIQDIADYLDVTIDYLIRDEITDPEYGKDNKSPYCTIEYDSGTVDMALNTHEQTHIKKYRALDEHGREVVDGLLNSEYTRIEAIEMSKKNTHRFTTSKPSYREEKELRHLPLYDLPASAGPGVFLDGNDYEIVDVDEDVPLNATFGVRISGDSMEPELYDGDIAWVKQQPTLDSGQIGVFIVDGEGYCKKLHKDEKSFQLVSLNKKRQNVYVDENSDIRTVGLVVGVTRER